MAVFAYRAMDVRRGGTLSGTIVADSPRKARDQLRGRGLIIHGLEAVSAGTGGRGRGRWGWLTGRGGTAVVTGFVRELATLLGVGVPMLEALDTIAVQHRGWFARSVLALRERVSAGMSLAEAMAEQPAVFDDFCVHLVEVGENAGNLDETLEHLAGFRERWEQLKGRIGTALLYPALVLTLALGVSIFLMTYVVPQLLEGLIEAGRPIPLPTRMVKGMSDGLIDGWPLILGGGLAAMLAGGWTLGTSTGRRLWHRIQLRLPLIGPLVMKQSVARIAMILAALMRSGIVFIKALQIARKTTSNAVLADALGQVEGAVGAGRDIAGALERTGAFTPTVVAVFAVGEQSGRLEEMLERLATGYDRQVATAVTRLTAVLEPALILLMVGVVGVIALATVLPMLEAGHVL